MLQTPGLSDGRERRFTIRHGTGVAPDDGRTERLEVPVNTDEAVHLIGNAYRGDIVPSCLSKDISRSCLEILPPHEGILLCPTVLE